MNSVQYHRLLHDIEKKQSIERNSLRSISTLRNCDRWDAVKELGYLKYEGLYIHYDGLLVQYRETIYYLPRKIVDVLHPFRKWTKDPVITVIEQNKGKKKKNQSDLPKKLSPAFSKWQLLHDSKNLPKPKKK